VNDQQEIAVVRWSSQRGLAELLTAYHLQTEAEKGQAVSNASELPDRYRQEIVDPTVTFSKDDVLLATKGDRAAGCLVLTVLDGGRSEIKRLWTDPMFRGQGVASLLMDAAIELSSEKGLDTIQLSVWKWRSGAISLYEKLGFIVTESWDEREELVCMQLGT
jgi:ribosomal protein S18 acetylase RimI-like enzyme